MEDLFNKIYSTEFLFEVFMGLDEGAIKDYYALFISSMAYYKFIKIDKEFANVLYVNIMNTSLKNTDQMLEKIDEFLINKSIDNMENELNSIF
ncbi:MAG: hypothetical protein J6T10_17455 [Methanobrevibacter sp.]|nr:hypothetical protein [Methanobrevibacter sp.]